MYYQIKINKIFSRFTLSSGATTRLKNFINFDFLLIYLNAQILFKRTIGQRNNNNQRPRDGASDPRCFETAPGKQNSFVQ